MNRPLLEKLIDKLIPVCILLFATVGLVAFGEAVSREPDRVFSVPQIFTVEVAEPQKAFACIPPPPPREVSCPTYHERAIASAGDTEIMNAYIEGAEVVLRGYQDFVRLPDSEKNGDTFVEACKFDAMLLVIEHIRRSVEDSNWLRACEELLLVWPTPPKEEGLYPEDFPEYCQ